MQQQTRKIILLFSIFLAMLFLLAQFAFPAVGSGGLCTPYLNAPPELGQPFYRFARYGFPLPFLDVAHESCFEAGTTTYEWSPVGLAVDGLLLALIAYPTWSNLIQRKLRKQS